MDCTAGLPRKPWDLPFVAEPEEVSGLRRILRTHLELWGLHEIIDAAQLCVSELVSNVITHVGVGTPTTLAVSMNGPYLRIEVHDPDARALPTLLNAGSEAETGRGVALIDAVADRWGVQPLADRKVTWCELRTELNSESGRREGDRVTRVEALLRMYRDGADELPHAAGSHSILSVTLAEETAIGMIADLLHWLTAQGCDVEGALDRAQTHFEGSTVERTDLPA
ncbi:ATP-binding protein [Streptomyces sp. 8P21H-1]|uniref:ATP-binding protein n=1 Tax=Streptomyces sp. 8P21H-1 TaxID=2737048 RepID=UPI0015700C95|nr:ATP-binding protein [Streptomyces sp. 8P21H-1]NSL43615.1 ATP-binding protein [Streptomyces sp. 8P21H-1]